jgi:hypothetical protein
VLVLLFLVCNKITGKGTKALNTLWRKLFFAPILIIVIEGFMDLSISGYVQLLSPLYTTRGEMMGSYLGYILVFLCFIVVPSSIIWTLIQSKDTFEDPDFKAMWGSCYGGITLRNNWTRAYHFVFILRRFIFILMGFLVKEPVFQFIILMVLNYFMTIY